MSIFEHADVISYTMRFLPSIMVLRVNRQLDAIVKLEPEYALWMKCRHPGDIFRYGSPKMIACHKHGALVAASKKGRLAVVKLLIGSEINFASEYDSSLHVASEEGHLAVVECLIAAGADIHSENGYALAIASANGQFRIVSCLVRHCAESYNDYRPLGWASEHGHLCIVKYLVKACADVDAGENYALKRSARNGHSDVVKFLVQSGAKITADTVESAHENVQDFLRLPTA